MQLILSIRPKLPEASLLDRSHHAWIHHLIRVIQSSAYLKLIAYLLFYLFCDLFNKKYKK
jgi:hypothetical protein